MEVDRHIQSLAGGPEGIPVLIGQTRLTELVRMIRENKPTVTELGRPPQLLHRSVEPQWSFSNSATSIALRFAVAPTDRSNTPAAKWDEHSSTHQRPNRLTGGDRMEGDHGQKQVGRPDSEDHYEARQQVQGAETVETKFEGRPPYGHSPSSYSSEPTPDGKARTRCADEPSALPFNVTPPRVAPI
jgi:hypothetical protein